ncbi:hypothetical protein [Methanoplanus endosymbiosus]|uniref:DUF4129 domain-containing protein n=1 Tax=Methanoplanus endosymbiosus TaxID=33865 RepID=A0A9E7PNJ6_9EURY|nr:hypothetical protein [Methanoplanus endosymbiosus]UUX92171.1 hypothetical protein L6E24_12550 [Methanoplanus endosymbiosus]
MKTDIQRFGVWNRSEKSGNFREPDNTRKCRRYGYFVFLLLLSLLAAPVLADDITFQTDRKDYYFSTGTEAEIAIGYHNDLGNAVSGQLSYKITEGVSSGGFSYSSSNTQSTPMTVPAGSGDFTLNGLYSDSKKDIDVDLSFQYSDGSDSKVVTLGTLTVHFTDDTSGKNQENPQTSTESQSSSSNQQSSSASQQMASQMQQQQNLINQMMGSQAQQPSSAQQALQNSQQSYNSESLKRQMEKMAEENAEEKSALSEAISGDELLGSTEEKLSEEGYEMTSESVNPQSMSDGSFTREYKNSAGDLVTLSGEMSDGEVKSVLESFDPEEQENLIPESLLNNETYRSYCGTLQKEGFASISAAVNYTKDEASFEQVFASFGDVNDVDDPDSLKGLNDPDGSADGNAGNYPKITAKLSPDLEVVNEVELIRDDDYSWLFPVLIILIIAVLAVSGWFAYKKYFSGNSGDAGDENVMADVGKASFDCRKYALNLLDEAESAFAEGDYVPAYGKAGQALRVYLSHHCYDGSEVTNEELFEIIGRIGSYSGDVSHVRNLLDGCSAVEFAKGSADEQQFDEFVRYIRNIIAENKV